MKTKCNHGFVNVLLLMAMSILPLNLLAAPILEWKGSSKKIIDEYLNLLDGLDKQMCQMEGADQVYDQYYKEYLGEGYTLPTLQDEQTLDKESIKIVIPELRNKLSWIKKIQSNFSSHSFSPGRVRKKLENIKNRLNVLLTLKGKYQLPKPMTKRGYLSPDRQDDLVLNSRIEMKNLLLDFEGLLDEIPYLLNYKFPIDHFTWRKRYDFYREKDDPQFKNIQNVIYMTRKILEDGAQNPNKSSSDSFLRALISTTTLRLQMEWDFIPDDLRYDLRSLISMIEKQMKYSKNELLQRLEEWKSRTERNLNYYEKISKGHHQAQNQSMAEEALIRFSNARNRLRGFNLDKQKETYLFWIKQPELMQALYTLDTILMNEVGGVDGQDALERKDVIQVVLNRLMDPFYSHLGRKDSLYLALQEGNGTQENYDKYKWPNVLFKEGEFSFTYFYLAASVRVYCPEMSKFIQKLRKENLQLILELLKNPNPDFKALRYFSRHSMLGRIDMSTLWKNYHPLSERPGTPIKAPQQQVKLKSLVKGLEEKKFTYLYSFESAFDQKKYYVLEFSLEKSQGESEEKKENYVISFDEKGPLFFNYRNPNYFRFFSKKDHD